MTHREFRRLFPEFDAPSWRGWNAIEDALFGVEPSDPDFVRRVTRRSTLPSEPVREFWAACGRGSGKSRFIARLACYFAAGVQYRRVAGERIYVNVVAPTVKQAAVTFSYIRGLLHSVPALDALIENETKDSIDLSTGVTTEVLPAAAAAPRARANVVFIIDETNFLPTDSSANPDVELIRAARPALARVPDSLLVVISSPYTQRGELHRTIVQKLGADDPDVLALMADTLTLNPSFSTREIARAFRDDPVSARSEYGIDGTIEFRQDRSTLLAEAMLMARVPVGVRELPPGREARGAFDASTLVGTDAAVAAVAFLGEPAALAAIRRFEPPGDIAEAIRESSNLFHRYGVGEVSIDRYAPGLVASLFQRHGIACVPSQRDTSANFIDLMALINCGGVVLLDEPVLLNELRRLERRPGLGGRETISHPLNGHDDVAAAAAGALVRAASLMRREPVPFDIIMTADLHREKTPDENEASVRRFLIAQGVDVNQLMKEIEEEASK